LNSDLLKKKAPSVGEPRSAHGPAKFADSIKKIKKLDSSAFHRNKLGIEPIIKGGNEGAAKLDTIDKVTISKDLIFGLVPKLVSSASKIYSFERLARSQEGTQKQDRTTKREEVLSRI
jgi:hypothetical protein